MHLLLALGAWREARVLNKGDLLNFVAEHKEHLKGVEIFVWPELWVHTIDGLLLLLVTCLLMQLLLLLVNVCHVVLMIPNVPLFIYLVSELL